jgi:hypothetical protein
MSLTSYQNTLRQHKLVKFLPSIEFSHSLKDLIGDCLKIMGQVNSDPMVIKAACDYTEKILQEKYGHYSFDEVKTVMEMGALGQLGDNAAMSARMVATWFRKYEADIRPTIARQHQESTIKLPEVTAPRDLTSDEARVYHDFALNDYLEDKTLYAFTYDILSNHGYTRLYQNNPKKYIELAERQFSNVIQQRKREQPVWQKFQNLVDKQDDRIVAYSKRLALKEYFDTLVAKQSFA